MLPPALPNIPAGSVILSPMAPFGKMLIIGGIVMVITGLILLISPRIPWLGRLPGDIRIEGKNSSFYFPVVTCIILSIILSIIMNLFGRR